MTSRTQDAATPARDRFGLAAPFGTLLYAWLITVACLAVAFTYALRLSSHTTETYFLMHQDLPVMLGLLAITGVKASAAVIASSPSITGRSWCIRK